MHDAARINGSPAPRGLNVNYISRWERGVNQPDRHHEHLLCLAFELPPERLSLLSDSTYRGGMNVAGDAVSLTPSGVGEPQDAPLVPAARQSGFLATAQESGGGPIGADEPGKMAPVDRRDFLRRALGVSALGLSPDQVAHLLSAVAHESRSHVARVELSNVGPITLEQLTSDVARLSRAFVSEPTLQVFAQLVETRDRIYARLDGRQFPAQTTDLYLLAGQTCALLAAACNDLGDRRAAAQQAQAAWAYGEMIGHDDLRAFARVTQSVIAYWSGAYGEAVKLAQAGQTYATSQNVLARLVAQEARAQAGLGNAGAVQALIVQAKEAIGRASVDAWATQDGELKFTPAWLNYYATCTFADVELNDEATKHGDEAIRLYRSTPNDLRSYLNEALCHIQLAEVSIRQGVLDGARVRLEPVLSLPAGRVRVTTVNEKLSNLQRQLAEPTVQGVDSRALTELIESF
jgi:hypothetical protein